MKHSRYIGSGNRCVRVPHSLATRLFETPVTFRVAKDFLKYIGAPDVAVIFKHDTYYKYLGQGTNSHLENKAIWLYPRGQNVWVMLHEISHTQADLPRKNGRFSYHGKEFGRMMELMVEFWLEWSKGGYQ